MAQMWITEFADGKRAALEMLTDKNNFGGTNQREQMTTYSERSNEVLLNSDLAVMVLLYEDHSDVEFWMRPMASSSRPCLEINDAAPAHKMG